MASLPSRTTTISLVTLLLSKARRVSSMSSSLSSTRRMMLLRSAMRALPLGRQRPVEHGAFAGDTFGPYASSVTLHDPPYGGQPHARSRELLVGMKPLKGREHLGGVRRVEPRAVVLDEERALGGPELDRRSRLLPREFPGVAQEV